MAAAKALGTPAIEAEERETPMSMAASVKDRSVTENGGTTQTSLPHSMRTPLDRFLG
jgi:hypothetical protein